MAWTTWLRNNEAVRIGDSVLIIAAKRGAYIRIEAPESVRVEKIGPMNSEEIEDAERCQGAVIIRRAAEEKKGGNG
jgi:sRNA-binding carbon storage regulator CsrA